MFNARQIELELRFLFLEELLNLIKLKSDIIAQLTVTFLLNQQVEPYTKVYSMQVPLI